MPSPKRARWGHIQTLIPGERYRIYWPDGHKEDGSRKPGTETIHGTWDDADLALAEKRIAAKGVDSDTTWREFWACVVVPTFDGLAERTRSDYLKVWDKHLDPRIGSTRVTDTTYRFACSVIASIDAPSAQRYAHRVWRKICNMACHEELLTYNPIDRSIRMKPRNRRPKHELNAWEAMKYIGSLAGSPYQAMALLEMVGGLRHEESTAVCSWDVTRVGCYADVMICSAVTEVDNRTVYKDTKNTFSERHMLFAEPFATLLLDIAQAADGPIFPSGAPEGNEPNASWFANPSRITARWGRWCERNDVRYIRPADMRTIYSDWQAEAGTPDSLVSLSMGHSTADTRGRNYQRRTRKGMELAADSLAEYLIESSPCAALWLEQIA